jgi:hypothetical protein
VFVPRARMARFLHHEKKRPPRAGHVLGCGKDPPQAPLAGPAPGLPLERVPAWI